MVHVIPGGATEKGRRDLNQDAILLAPRVWAVADGMGGHAAGEVASRHVIDRLPALAQGSRLTGEVVVATIQRLHRELLVLGERPELAGLGTTLAGLVHLDSGMLLALNVGDSRIYRWRDRTFVQISLDHSVTAELVRGGEMEHAEASTDPRRHTITRALGVGQDLVVDTWELVPEDGDVFLLCSDGLTNELDDADVAGVLARWDSPQHRADALVQEALRRGARDNVSAVVVEVRPEPARATTGHADDDTVPRADLRVP